VEEYNDQVKHDVLVTKVETVDEYVAMMTVGKERKKTTSKCF
jgi:hypothetical protein